MRVSKAAEISGKVIIKEGSTDEREVARLGEGTYFGELALLRDEPRMATVTALVPTVCMSVDRLTFTQVLGPVQELIEREAKRRKEEAERLAARPRFVLSELSKVGLLGVGTFGRVSLVEHTKSPECYALKRMRKKQLIALNQVEHVMNEITLLAACDHPFLINLVSTFQDRYEVYMVLELALGGELFSLLHERGRFDEPTARFYAANVGAAFLAATMLRLLALHPEISRSVPVHLGPPHRSRAHSSTFMIRALPTATSSQRTCSSIAWAT